METLAILQALRDLLADPKHWTQHELARNETNYAADPLNPAAVSYCLAGGLTKVLRNRGTSLEFHAARGAIIVQTGGVALARFNDEASHEEMLAVLDKAIAACEP